MQVCKCCRVFIASYGLAISYLWLIQLNYNILAALLGCFIIFPLQLQCMYIVNKTLVDIAKNPLQRALRICFSNKTS